MISYIMMVYNEEKHIREAISSVLNQGKSIELIIVDDGSCDCTPAIIGEIAQHDARIKILEPGHIGKNAAANLGVSKAVGDWICLVAGDDVLADGALDRVEAAVMGVDARTERAAVFSQLQMFSDNARYDGVRIPKNPHRVNLAGSYAYMSKALADDMFPIPEYLPNEDGWSGLYYRYLLDSKICIYEVMAYYRIHSGNSLDKDASFDVYNEAYHSRAMVVDAFINEYQTRLNALQIHELESSRLAEQYRYEGKTLSIILMPSLSLKDRLRNVMLSNSGLYSIKLAFNRYFLGH